MKNRCNKFVFENEEGLKIEAVAPKGMAFEISNGTKGELIIKTIDAKNVIAMSNCSENYANPPIPNGYKHIEGEWYDGFVIQRISDKSELVWIPVGFLDSDGTFDGENFIEKFGRRNYRNDEFSESVYHEELVEELLRQKESVDKYGGFYLSCYRISKGIKGNPQSKKGAKHWLNISYNDAQKIASEFEKREDVKSHLTFGCEYDSVLAWFIKSRARTLEEIAKDSTDWGNYKNTKNSLRKVVESGENQKACTNRIYDFAGNENEYTQENVYKTGIAIRDGNYRSYGYNYPVANRQYCHKEGISRYIGFRVALYIK